MCVRFDRVSYVVLTEMQVTYSLEAGAKWKIAMRATVDQESPILLRYVLRFSDSHSV